MTISRWRRALVPVFLIVALGSALAFAACGDDDDGDGGNGSGEEPVATAGDIQVFAPTLRFTLGDTAAGYFTVRNTGDEADRLVAASSDVAGVVQLHETVTDDGASRMQPIEGGLEIPAGGEATLVPGGIHVMFMNMEEPLEDGDEVTLTLTFENAGEVSFTVPAAQMGSNGDGEDDMDGMSNEEDDDSHEGEGESQSSSRY